MKKFAVLSNMAIVETYLPEDVNTKEQSVIRSVKRSKKNGYFTLLFLRRRQKCTKFISNMQGYCPAH